MRLHRAGALPPLVTCLPGRRPLRRRGTVPAVGSGVSTVVRVFGLAALGVLVGVAGCAQQEPQRVVRGADEVQVMSPADVAAARAAIDIAPPTTAGEADTPGPAAPTSTPTGVDDTIPLNQDDRPPELRLFEAFGEFRGCIEDKGYVIEGNLQDPNNPAYADPAYREAVSTCAARTDIINILAEVQATRSDLTPEQVEERNEAFVALQGCLEGKGWTVESRISEIGLLEPVVFQGPDGTLDDRDIDQCVSELNIGEG